jgi:uncharacterized protein (TIGR03067 family)
MVHLQSILLLLAGLAASQLGADVDKERKLLQGRWEVVSMVQGGKEVPRLMEGKMMFTFQGDKLVVALGDKVLNEGTWKIDPGKTPRTIDLKDERDTIQGIYELKENEVRMCMGGRGKERPKLFDAQPGTDQSVVILKRIK